MTINVGLGTGTKSEQLAQLQMIIGAQEKAIQSGAGIVSAKNLFASAVELTKLGGHQDVEKFFTAPGTPPNPLDPTSAPIAPPADPMQGLAQAKAQADADKMKGDQAHQLMKTQADIAFQKQKLDFDMAKEQQKFELERELALLNAQLKEREHVMQQQAMMQQHVATLAGGQRDDEGNPTGPDLATIQSLLAAMQPPPHPPPRGMRVVRDAQGLITHTEPL
jgi:hypothetical protein